MAIQSVRVLDDGWHIEVTGSWPASAVSDFALFDEPETVAGIAAWDETTARVIVTCISAGHNRVGGQAVPATRARIIVCHDLGRLPYSIWPEQPAGPTSGGFQGWPLPRANNRPLGEVDLGGGQRRIRLRLHKPIEPGATFSVQFRAGWRAGLGAETVSAAACVNDSSTPIEAPSARWLTAPYDGIRDTSFKRISVHAAHGLPEGKRGVAGVRFVATDGVNKATAWADLGWDESYGDRVRCWTADMDLTGLNAGPIVVNWSVFPWVGLVRHSCGVLDPATATASALLPADSDWAFVGVDVRTENPLIFGYDPAGSYYGYTSLASVYHKYVCIAVDPAGGVVANPTTRAQAEALCGFGATAEAARAAALAIVQSGRPRSTLVALHAVRQLARALPSAQVAGKGRTARSNVGDGIEIFLLDGTHVAGGGANPSAMGFGEIFVRYEGAGKSDCILQSRPAGGGAARLSYGSRARVRGVHARLDVSAWTEAYEFIHWEQCRLDRLSASTATLLTTLQPQANRANFEYHNCDLEAGPNYGNLNGLGRIVRSCRYRTPISSPVITDCETFGASGHNAVLTYGPSAGSAATAHFDVHRWNNRHLGYQFNGASTCINIPWVTISGRLRVERFVLVNNLIECVGGGSTFLMRIGETMTTPLDVHGMVVEGNTFTGNRVNWLYSDMNASNSTQSQDPLFGVFYQQNWNSNNVFDHWAMKGDTFADPGADSARAAAFPGETAPGRQYLGQASSQHPCMFGFMMEGNVTNFFAGPGTVNAFTQENRGLRALVPPTAVTSANANWLDFVDNRDANHGAAGFGDYRPAATAPWRQWARNAQIDAGADGVLRTGVAFPAGALAGGAGPESVESQPQSAAHELRSTQPALGFVAPEFAVQATGSRLSVLASQAVLLAIGAGPPSGPWRRVRVGAENRVRTPERD